MQGTCVPSPVSEESTHEKQLSQRGTTTQTCRPGAREPQLLSLQAATTEAAHLEAHRRHNERDPHSTTRVAPALEAAKSQHSQN